jgi:hypothetical protein
MAEGPLVHHYANRLRRLLRGKEVRVEFGIKRLIFQKIGCSWSI